MGPAYQGRRSGKLQLVALLSLPLDAKLRSERTVLTLHARSAFAGASQPALGVSHRDPKPQVGLSDLTIHPSKKL
jgi:hypothetical protein